MWMNAKCKMQKRSDVAETRWNSAHTKAKIKGKLEEAIEKLKGHDVKIKKKK